MPDLRIAGIIPAYAGNTLRFPFVFSPTRGSSPHTRGTLEQDHPIISRVKDQPRIRGEHCPRPQAGVHRPGIIPAYAGNTRHVVVIPLEQAGSSPHTRGTRPHRCRTCRTARDHPRIRGEHRRRPRRPSSWAGIIPAYAGNTRRVDASEVYLPGSSPHTRGTRHVVGRLDEAHWDHPRIRGEHERPN